MIKNKNRYVLFSLLFIGMQNIKCTDEKAKKLKKVGYEDTSKCLGIQGPSGIIYASNNNIINSKHKTLLYREECTHTIKTSTIHAEEAKIFLDVSEEGVGYDTAYTVPANLSENGVRFLQERAKVKCEHKKAKVFNKTTFDAYKQKKETKAYEKNRLNKISTGVKVGIIAGLAGAYSMGALEKQTEVYCHETNSFVPVKRDKENTRHKLGIFLGICAVAVNYVLYHDFKYTNFVRTKKERATKKMNKEIALDNEVLKSTKNREEKINLATGGEEFYSYNGPYWKHAKTDKFQAQIKNLQEQKNRYIGMQNLTNNKYTSQASSTSTDDN